MDRFADRLLPAGYSQDESFRVCLVASAPGSETSPAEAWIPERIFERLLHLGSAYGLHVLTTVSRDEETLLQALQCESLLGELEFLGDLLPLDAALRGVLGDVVPLVQRAARSGGRLCAAVQPP